MSGCTDKMLDIILSSKKKAYSLQSSYIGPEHMLLAILEDANNEAYRMFQQKKVIVDALEKELHAFAKDRAEKFINTVISNSKNKTIDPAVIDLTNIPYNWKYEISVKMGYDEMRDLGSSTCNTLHLLLGILKENNNIASHFLDQYGVYYSPIKECVTPDSRFYEEEEDNNKDDYEDEGITRRGYQSHSEDNSRLATTEQADVTDSDSFLDAFSFDLTQAAREGKLDPVVGREKEIDRMIQILSRRKKNNPVLIGDPGVGKSAIVEGLALRIVERNISPLFFDKRILRLDLSSVVAGTKYRGEFEERITRILKEVKKDPNIILFIDEIHTLVGTGATVSSMDAANILKPALARGELQCIGATTLDEYRQSIEKDGALERRFQKIIVAPTTADETLVILQNIKDKYEDYHSVKYTDKALEACVRLTERYVTDRKFPDKAIDAMDEAGSRVCLANCDISKEVESLELLIKDIQWKKNQAAKDQNFELASNFREQEKINLQKLKEIRDYWSKQQKENKETINVEDIEEVVSLMTGIPVQRMAESENEKLRGMKDTLMKKVIAQDKAVDTVVKAIRRSRMGLKDPNKPIGTFLFLGPTGVGKTHLAKQLAVEMFGSSEALIRVDMSEFMEKHTVSRLIGAPPGYVGYEEGGQLTEKVRRKPYSIILLDEIEKAHPDVFNILLQVMDEGRLTDNIGKTIDFKNTIIIMTSNVGTRQLKEFGKGIGFAAQMSSAVDNERSRSVISKALNKTFSPEFLNRLDEIVTFDQLDITALTKIVDIELKNFFQRVESIGYKITIDEEAKRFVAEKGYDLQFGARPLKRSIQNHLEDGLAEFLIETSPELGSTIQVTLKEDRSALLFQTANA